jgi:hypothetical protein
MTTASSNRTSKGKVLVVMSGAHLLEMPDNKVYATGYYLNELATPLRALIKAGYTPSAQTRATSLCRSEIKNFRCELSKFCLMRGCCWLD